MADPVPAGALTWVPEDDDAAGTLPMLLFKSKNWELDPQSTSGHLVERHVISIPS